MPSRREALLDAAITVLGTGGARALTHRAVDQAAGVPPGSTSNHFRTRHALLAGIAARLVERDHEDLSRLGVFPAASTLDELVRITQAWIDHALGPDRTRTAARYALFLEAADDASLQGPLRQARGALVDWVADVLSRLSDDPQRDAPLLMDWVDGVVLHQLAMPRPDFDPRPGVEHLARALLTAGGSPPR